MARWNIASLKLLLGGALIAATSLALAQTVSPQMYSDMDWRLIGPSRGGRAVAVSGVPGDGTTFYFGAVDGGVWKTTNAGTTWKPIFDKGQLTKGSFTNPQIVQQQKALLASVEAITSGAGAGLGLDQANSDITAALNVAESSDRAIPSQAIQVYAEASAATELRTKECAALKQGALAQFNQKLKRERLAPIAISAIKYEVYLLMTQ